VPVRRRAPTATLPASAMTPTIRTNIANITSMSENPASSCPTDGISVSPGRAIPAVRANGGRRSKDGERPGRHGCARPSDEYRAVGDTARLVDQLPFGVEHHRFRLAEVDRPAPPERVGRIRQIGEQMKVGLVLEDGR